MGLQGGWSAAAVRLVAKPCDSCKTSAAALFCRADLAFLCLACDARIHASNKLTTRHERVWMCEVCEQAPAAVTCKADAAALCVTCDADIHSANPLARRHERVPVEPFYDSAESIIVKSTTTAPLSAAAAFNYLVPNGDVLSNTKDIENDAASNWLIPNPNFNSKLQMDIAPDIIKSSGELLFPEMDSLLEFDYPNSIHNISGAGTGTDSVVPVQPDPIPPPSFNMNHNISGPADQNCFDLDFCRSKLSSSFSYPTQSLSQSVSSSSLDVGVVPDGNSLSDISYPFGRNANNNVLEPGDISYSFGPKASNNVSEPDDISYPFGRKASNNVSEPGVPVSATPASQPATQLCGLDREARVLRYREKRKNRKFQKTIRYASRKAYAETRPRIKGRFAKRTETETVDRIYGSGLGAFIPDPQFGVVPTF